MNMANMPKPNSRAARFVLHTAGMRIMRMSTRGERERDSEKIQSPSSTAVAAKSRSTVGLCQPHVGPYETASKPVTSQPDMSSAPSQLMCPPVRTGDSGTKMKVATVAPSAITKGSQNSQWYDRCSRIGPASRMPPPTPSPKMADSTPMAPATRSGGNSSRMMPKARGKTAPAAPWMTRPTSMIVSDVASALTSVPTLSAISTMTIIFFLPVVSPRRPRMGVAMAALSRYAVSNQLALSSEVCKVCSSWGMAGMISDCNRLNASAAVARTTKVTPE